MKQLSEKQLEKVWSKQAETYQKFYDKNPDYLAYFVAIEQTITSVAGDMTDKKILDVGCGTAITSAYLAKKGAKLSLVDISNVALRFAKKYFAFNKLSAKFFCQSAFKMSFAKESFDVVWNGGVIEHFTDKNKIKIIKKMWQLVKPGGMMLISVPNIFDIPFMLAKQLLIMRGKWGFGEEDNMSANRIKKLFFQAGINDSVQTFCYNPIVGWWFFPYGKELTGWLGLNKLSWHQRKCWFGHNVIAWAVKSSTKIY